MSLTGFGSTLTLSLRRPALRVACLSLVLAGCATYQPPDLPPRKKAVIYLTQFPYPMSFQTLDGKDVAWGSTWRTVKMKSLEIAPGKHTVSVQVTMRFFEETYDGTANIPFTAKAGKSYVIRTRIGSSDHQDLKIWVEPSKQEVPDPF